MHCRICGSGDAHKLFDIPYLPPFELRWCPACRLGFTEPALGPGEIGRYYPPAYYGAEGKKFSGFVEILVRLSRFRRAQRILRYKRWGRILDVGCGGRPQFLRYMQARGWEAHGNELAEFPDLRRLEELGVRFQIRDFLLAEYQDGAFDTVVFWHVLEHMPDPVAALRKAARLLRPGGLLVLALPNLASLQARVSGPHWFHLDIPRHYFHFTLDAAKRLLAAEGFRVDYVSHFSFEQDLFGWVQSLYNLLGFPHGLLYDLLRNRSARLSGPEPPGAARILLMLGLLPFVGAAGAALFLLDVCLRRGGCMEIYALREPVYPAAARRAAAR